MKKFNNTDISSLVSAFGKFNLTEERILEALNKKAIVINDNHSCLSIEEAKNMYLNANLNSQEEKNGLNQWKLFANDKIDILDIYGISKNDETEQAKDFCIQKMAEILGIKEI